MAKIQQTFFSFEYLFNNVYNTCIYKTITCHVKENYLHLFINCRLVHPIWQKVEGSFRHCGISQNIKSLKNIVIGYKYSSDDYKDINLVLITLGFCIYKANIMSEKRTKYINILQLFISELNTCQEYFKETGVRSMFLVKFIKHITNI